MVLKNSFIRENLPFTDNSSVLFSATLIFMLSKLMFVFFAASIIISNKKSCIALTEKAESYFYEVCTYEDIELDIDEEDTHTDWLHITTEEYEGGYYTVLNIGVNGEELKVSDYKFCDGRYYLVNNKGVFSLCAELELADNSTVTLVYDINGEKAELIEALSNTKFADADLIQ